MSSSIFNFETWRRYGHLPRRERAYHLALVSVSLGIPIVCTVLVALLLEPVPPHRQETATLRPITQTLLVGSSHTRFGLHPHLFTHPTGALAASGADYLTLEVALKNNLDRVPDLRLAIIELDPILLIRDALSFMGDDHRSMWSLGVRPWDLAASARRPALFLEWGQWRVRAEIDRVRLSLRTLLRWALDRAPPAPPGYHPLVGQLEAGVNDGALRAAAHARQHSRLRLADHANVDALLRMLALLAQRGVGFVLVMPPHHPEYWAHWPQRFQPIVERATQALRARWGSTPGFEIWDLHDGRPFSDAEYYDGNHLNHNGSRRFTRMIDARVEAWWAVHVGE